MKPHPIFTSAGASPYEVTKAGVQALFLFGRYRTEKLCSHWSNNKAGHCLMPSCDNLGILEDEEHILLHCSSLASTRNRLAAFTARYSTLVPDISNLLLTYLHPNNPDFYQFLIDCSVIPEVISVVQRKGPTQLNYLFKVTRTWCYSIHLGRWPF